MSDVLGLTTYSAIRAQLGVSTTDAPNTLFDDLNIIDELKSDLLSWFPNYEAALVDTSGDAQVENQKLLLGLYAKVYCASVVSLVAPMKFLETRKDGDTSGSRFSFNNSLKDYQQSLNDRAEAYKLKVTNISTPYFSKPTTAAIPAVIISKPSRDAITGQ